MITKEQKTQIKVDVLVGRSMGWYGYNKEQTIGFVMISLNLFYDNAKQLVEKSLKTIKKIEI